jgi:hypothetical protein
MLYDLPGMKRAVKVYEEPLAPVKVCDLSLTELQQRRWEMVTMPRYEVRYHENEDWKEISELELMDGLYRLYRRATPAIKEMLTGKELRTPGAVYRLKWQSG